MEGGLATTSSRWSGRCPTPSRRAGKVTNYSLKESCFGGLSLARSRIVYDMLFDGEE
jgi:hypothetical protein